MDPDIEPKTNVEQEKPQPDIEPAPGRSAGSENEEEIENPVRIRPFEGPGGTPGHAGNERIIQPVHPGPDPYPGVHVH